MISSKLMASCQNEVQTKGEQKIMDTGKSLGDAINVLEAWVQQVVSTVVNTFLLPLNLIQALFRL